MTLCVVHGKQCCCQPDEGVFCPDLKPNAYVASCHAAIKELIAERTALETDNAALRKSLINACVYIAMNGPDAEDELCIVKNCAFAVGIQPEEIDVALLAKDDDSLNLRDDAVREQLLAKENPCPPKEPSKKS